MTPLNTIENTPLDTPKKELSFPTKEFKKVEYYDNDGRRSLGFMVRRDKQESQIISGVKRYTVPNERVKEIEPSNGDGRDRITGACLIEQEEQEESKFNYLKQYRNKEIPQDWAIFGVNADGQEKIILGDVAGIDVMDDDPNMCMFVDAATRQQIVIERGEIYDIRANKKELFHFNDIDEDGNEFVHSGYLSTVTNGRCFFESAETEDVMVLPSVVVYSSNSLKSVTEINNSGESNEVEIDVPQEENDDPFDFRTELINRLNRVIISSPPRTEQQKFIEMGKTKTRIQEMTEREKTMEDSAVDFFVAKSAQQMQNWKESGLFQYFATDERKEFDYCDVYERLDQIKQDWLGYKSNLAFVQKIILNVDGSSRMSQIRYYQEKELELEEDRQDILSRMNFVKKQVNKLDYLKNLEKDMSIAINGKVFKNRKSFFSMLSMEERVVVIKHVRQKINSKYTSVEFKKYMSDNTNNIIGEIKIIRRLNQGEFWNVMSEVWNGFKKTWNDFDSSLSHTLNKELIPPKPKQRRWWKRIKGWFRG